MEKYVTPHFCWSLIWSLDDKFKYKWQDVKQLHKIFQLINEVQ